MKNVMGIIMALGSDEGLRDLTLSRPVANLPLGGRYNVIDFVLSNMVNSGIRKTGIITRNNYHTLMCYLGNGDAWGLNSKKEGLFILPPYLNEKNYDWYRRSANALYNALDYIRTSNQKYVLLSESNSIYNISYKDAMNFHISRKADVTMFYTQAEGSHREDTEHANLRINQHGKVSAIEYGARVSDIRNTPLGIYILEKNLLEDMITEGIILSTQKNEADILNKKLNELEVYGYCFTGYSKTIDSVSKYFEVNLDILKPEIRNELFNSTRPICTKFKDAAPARYGRHAVVNNCIVADGAVIEGEVSNSIIFPGVEIQKWTNVKNCVVMQNTIIHEGCELENVILDKKVRITNQKRLISNFNYPMVIPKGMVI